MDEKPQRWVVETFVHPDAMQAWLNEKSRILEERGWALVLCSVQETGDRDWCLLVVCQQIPSPGRLPG